MPMTVTISSPQQAGRQTPRPPQPASQTPQQAGTGSGRSTGDRMHNAYEYTDLQRKIITAKLLGLFLLILAGLITEGIIAYSHSAETYQKQVAVMQQYQIDYDHAIQNNKPAPALPPEINPDNQDPFPYDLTALIVGLCFLGAVLVIATLRGGKVLAFSVLAAIFKLRVGEGIVHFTLASLAVLVVAIIAIPAIPFWASITAAWILLAFLILLIFTLPLKRLHHSEESHQQNGATPATAAAGHSNDHASNGTKPHPIEQNAWKVALAVILVCLWFIYWNWALPGTLTYTILGWTAFLAILLGVIYVFVGIIRLLRAALKGGSKHGDSHSGPGDHHRPLLPSWVVGPFGLILVLISPFLITTLVTDYQHYQLDLHGPVRIFDQLTGIFGIHVLKPPYRHWGVATTPETIPCWMGGKGPQCLSKPSPIPAASPTPAAGHEAHRESQKTGHKMVTENTSNEVVPGFYAQRCSELTEAWQRIFTINGLKHYEDGTDETITLPDWTNLTRADEFHICFETQDPDVYRRLAIHIGPEENRSSGQYIFLRYNVSPQNPTGMLNLGRQTLGENTQGGEITILVPGGTASKIDLYFWKGERSKKQQKTALSPKGGSAVFSLYKPF